MVDIKEELGPDGAGRDRPPHQVKKAELFAKMKPRLWWAFTQLPEGQLRTRMASQIVADNLDEPSEGYLWRFADRLDDRGGKVRRHTRPSRGDRVDVCGEIEQVILKKGGRVIVDFDSDPGWRGRLVISQDDMRFHDLEVVPESRIRVRGICLSRPSDTIHMIGDRPGDITSQELRVEVIEEGWE
jgi:hypothetical protein